MRAACEFFDSFLLFWKQMLKNPDCFPGNTKKTTKKAAEGSLFVFTLCDLERHKAKTSQQLELFLQSNCASSSQRNNAQSNSNVYKVNRTGSGVAFVLVSSVAANGWSCIC